MADDVGRQLDEAIQSREQIVKLWEQAKSDLEEKLTNYEVVAQEIEAKGGDASETRKIIQDLRDRANDVDQMLRNSVAELRGMVVVLKSFLADD